MAILNDTNRRTSNRLLLISFNPFFREEDDVKATPFAPSTSCKTMAGREEFCAILCPSAHSGSMRKVTHCKDNVVGEEGMPTDQIGVRRKGR